jgi:hypothetical protein
MSRKARSDGSKRGTFYRRGSRQSGRSLQKHDSCPDQSRLDEDDVDSPPKQQDSRKVRTTSERPKRGTKRRSLKQAPKGLTRHDSCPDLSFDPEENIQRPRSSLRGDAEKISESDLNSSFTHLSLDAANLKVRTYSPWNKGKSMHHR